MINSLKLCGQGSASIPSVTSQSHSDGIEVSQREVGKAAVVIRSNPLK
ncbi:hypothetical protein A2U01_0063747, partial [Trifolium medium]|nr:hypothetical protein [Trifolium medium]